MIRSKDGARAVPYDTTESNNEPTQSRPGAVGGSKSNLQVMVLLTFLFCCYRLASNGSLAQYRNNDFVETTTTLSSPSSLISYSNASESEEACRMELHLCRRPRIFFPPYLQDLNPVYSFTNNSHQTTNITTQDSVEEVTPSLSDRPWQTSMKMSYQCGGEDYYTFGQKLLGLHKEQTTSKEKQHWGYRPTPIPGANKRIFFMGNSHTRQQIEALLCQYNDVIQSGQMLGSPSKHRIGNEGIVVFPNNNTIRWFLNSPYVYAGSVKWKNLTQDHIGEPLDDFDLLVVGRFNQKKNSKGTTFYQEMLEAQRKNPDINIESNTPPTVIQISHVYSGHILVVGSFDVIASKFTPQIQQEVAYLNNDVGRTNVAILDARQYIPTLGECGAQQKYAANECLDKKQGQNEHRCQGAYGGLTDLAAWDIVEHFYKSLI